MANITKHNYVSHSLHKLHFEFSEYYIAHKGLRKNPLDDEHDSVYETQLGFQSPLNLQSAVSKFANILHMCGVCTTVVYNANFK